MTTSNTGGPRPRFAYVGGFIVFDIDLEHTPMSTMRMVSSLTRRALPSP